MKKLLLKSKIKNVFKNQAVQIALISLTITLFVCSLVGISGYFLFNRFWASFILGFVAQFIIFVIYNTYLVRKDRLEYAKIVNDQLSAINKYNIQISCAYCRQNNTVPVILNQENRFECEYCKQISGIRMQFFSTQLTVPIEKVILPGSNENESVVFNVTSAVS